MVNSEKIAGKVSSIFSPFVLAPIFIVWISIFSTNSVKAGLLIAILTTLTLVAPAIIYIQIQMRRGIIKDFHVKDRAQRKPVYIIFFMSVSATFALLYFLSAPKELYAGLLSVLAVNIINFGVNRYTKISIHTGTLAGISMILFLLVGLIPALVGIGLTILVGWSRVKLQAHTPKQVILGALNGTITTLIVFKLFGF